MKIIFDRRSAGVLRNKSMEILVSVIDKDFFMIYN